jgi:hypothetical protein
VQEYGDINYLTSEALGNLFDFSYKCPRLFYSEDHLIVHLSILAISIFHL